MHQAMLWDKLPDSRVQCHTCQWRCRIAPGKSGVCRVYQNREGTLFNMNYAAVSSMAADPVEKKPLFHFHPGTVVFSLGGWGCNFHCTGCQNWEISCPPNDAPWAESREITPQAAVEMTLRNHCNGIAWTYNEPSMWFEYTLESARLAKEHGLYTVYVTNGFLTPEALDAIGPYLDAWRVDVKGFTDALYKKIARIRGWRGILEVAQRARHKWNMHVEVVTNIMPTLNDDDFQLGGITAWISRELGELTPWHITRFYPQHDMREVPPTPVATIEHAYAIGRKAGLKFIYAGNLPGHKSESTICYSCGNLIVERYGYQTRVLGLDGSRCRFCGAELNFPAGPKGGNFG
jgi:pyruvate formate lyase activating enzyme